MKIQKTEDYRLIAVLNKPVHDLHHKLYPDVFKPYDEDVMAAYFKAVISEPNHLFLVITADETPIGYVWVEEKTVAESAFRKERRHLNINQMSLNEACRGKGYGKALIQKVIELAEKRGIERIELDYWCKNTEAEEFYDRIGFQVYRKYAHLDI